MLVLLQSTNILVIRNLRITLKCLEYQTYNGSREIVNVEISQWNH